MQEDANLDISQRWSIIFNFDFVVFFSSLEMRIFCPLWL